MRKRDLEILALGAAIGSSPAPRTEYVTRTVHEHRAPTDDSIRLAAEYEEKAWKKVTGRLIDTLPTIDAKVIVCERACEIPGKHLLFSVNNRRVRLFLEEDRSGRKDMLRAVADEIAEEIVKQLLMADKGQWTRDSDK